MCTHRYAFFCSFHVFVLQWPPLMWNLFEKWIQTLFVFEDVMGKESATMVIDKEIKTVNESSKKTRAMKAFTMKWPCEQFKKFQNCISPAFTHSVLGIFFLLLLFVFLFFCFFSFCLRRASSITWASQTPNQWLIDCPSSRHGHTSVSLTATKKKQEYKLGFTVWWRAKEQIIDNHDTNLSLILKKTLFYCLPWFPIVPCLVSVDIGME